MAYKKIRPSFDFIVFTALIISPFFTMSMALGQVSSVDMRPDCPAADTGYTAGCLYLHEDSSDPSSEEIRIFYQWFGTYDPARESLIVINGGPGGSQRLIQTVPQMLDLEKTYNLLFYDQ